MGGGDDKGMDHGWGYGRRRTSWNMEDRLWGSVLKDWSIMVITNK